MPKKRICLTGASGSMGGEAFKELLKYREQYDIVLLLRPSRKNKKAFRRYEGQQGVSIVWGDLCHPPDVERFVEGADHVLHAAALIPPKADHRPVECIAVICGGTANIISAIKKQPGGAERIRLVFIGSVAEYGDRLPPMHMLRVGDPLRPSVGDIYSTAKVATERMVIESGIRYWAVLRQTFIAIPNLLSLMDPIMFHQPLDTRIELITSADAGFGLAKTVEAPEEFYARVYNMSGGPACRVIYSDYLESMWKVFGLGDYRKAMSPNWFATRNFHCGWYEDSHVLNQYLGHWRHTLEDYEKQVAAAIPWYLKLGGRIAPAFIVRAFMKTMCDPLKWIRGNEEEKIKAFFGSREVWEKIPDWDSHATMTKEEAGQQVSSVVLNTDDVQEMARARGGQCLSAVSGDKQQKLKWRCGFGHEWEATSQLVSLGHWCPKCAPPPWDYDNIAKIDPLLANYHYFNHGKEEEQKVQYLFCPVPSIEGGNS